MAGIKTKIKLVAEYTGWTKSDEYHDMTSNRYHIWLKDNGYYMKREEEFTNFMFNHSLAYDLRKMIDRIPNIKKSASLIMADAKLKMQMLTKVNKCGNHPQLFNMVCLAILLLKSEHPDLPYKKYK